MSKSKPKNTWYDPDAVTTSVELRPLLRFAVHLRDVKGRVAFCAAVSLVFSSVAYLIPLVFEWVELSLREGALGALVVALAAYWGIMSLQQVARYIVAKVQTGIYTEISERVLLDYYENLLNIRVPDYLALKRSTSLFQRVVDASYVAQSFTSVVLRGVLDVSSLVVFGIIIGMISWEMLVLLSIGGILLSAYVLWVTPQVRRLHSTVLGVNYPLVQKMMEVINSMITIKSLTASIEVTRDVQELTGQSRESVYNRDVYKTQVSAVTSFIRTTTIVGALGLGFALHLRGSLELSALFAAYVLMSSFLDPLSDLASIYRRLAQLSVNLTNYYEVMDHEKEAVAAESRAQGALEHGLTELSGTEGDAVPAPTAVTVQPSQSTVGSSVAAGAAVFGSAPGRISFENVRFGYDPERPVIEGLSFEIEPGERVALIGRSGAGKTTLFRLLLGFIEPQVGRILVDGHDISTLDLNAHRRRFGIVGQRDFLFEISIRDNLTMGLGPCPEEKLVGVLQSVNLWDHVRSLDQQLDEVYSDDVISGGQRQRLLVARALVRDPSVVLLDEPTSALDFENEREILNALDRLVSGKTALIIAHRLSTVQSADRVIVLDQGRVVGDGTHRALYDGNDYYRSLCDFNSVIV